MPQILDELPLEQKECSILLYNYQGVKVEAIYSAQEQFFYLKSNRLMIDAYEVIEWEYL